MSLENKLIKITKKSFDKKYTIMLSSVEDSLTTLHKDYLDYLKGSLNINHEDLNNNFKKMIEYHNYYIKLLNFKRNYDSDFKTNRINHYSKGDNYLNYVKGAVRVIGYKR